MSAQIWTYLLVGVTFCIYMIIAIVARAGSTKEFYVAGGGVHPIVNGMATAADWMSAASFLSMAGLIAFMGFSGGQYLMGWTGGYVLLALLLAPYLRKFGKFTVPDFIGERYYSKNARLVALICALFISFTYVVGQMKGVGVAFARFLNVPFDTGVLIGIGIVFFLCCIRWHERYYLYPSSPVLCFDFCFYSSCYLHITSNDRQSNSTSWFWIQRNRWGVPS